MGIVYFIQPAELVGTNRYKVGCSSKDDLSRLKTYKTGTRMLMILQCNDPFTLEQRVIKQFKDQFTKIAGNEYFEGGEFEMRKIFYDTYLQWEQHIITLRNNRITLYNNRITLLNESIVNSLKEQIILLQEYIRVLTGEEDNAIIADYVADYVKNEMVDFEKAETD